MVATVQDRAAPAFVEWLRSLNMSARRLSAYTGVSNSTASQWLRGAVPNRQSVERLGAGLHVEPEVIEALIRGELAASDMPQSAQSIAVDDPAKVPGLRDIATFHPSTITMLRDIGGVLERSSRVLLLEGEPPKQVAEDAADYEATEDEPDP